jgi:hypothetical protein
MKHIGKLTGTGRLAVGDKEIGPIKYVIDVYQPHAFTEATGTLNGDDAVILQALGKDTAALILETGEPVAILINQHSLGSGSARFIVSGPVPGFQP